MAVLGPVTSRVTGKLMGAGMEDMSEVHGNDSPWEPEIRDWAFITERGGGATKWENRGHKPLWAPHQDRFKLFAPPPLLRVATCCPPPSIWLQLQASA